MLYWFFVGLGGYYNRVNMVVWGIIISFCILVYLFWVKSNRSFSKIENGDMGFDFEGEEWIWDTYK